jgi:putative glutamine amidotransferase
MKKPLIGIAADRVPSPTHGLRVELPDKYVEAILQSGGIPLLIPIGLAEPDLPELINRIDGILLAGGGDIEPSLFNGSPHASIYGINFDRDQQEIELTKLALQSGIPLLGICRGIQVMNVAMQGGLHTHLLDQLPHALQHSTDKNLPRDFLAHTVRIEPASQLYHIIHQEEISVNSHHHQGIDHPAPGLIVTATAPDGAIEAVENEKMPFFLGVQWHPEWLLKHAHAQALFNAFTEAAIQYHHVGSSA